MERNINRGGHSIYSYEEQKKELFTDEGQKLFLKIRDRAHNLLKISGVFSYDRSIKRSMWGFMGNVSMYR
jgi:hypothetical protein